MHTIITVLLHIKVECFSKLAHIRRNHTNAGARAEMAASSLKEVLDALTAEYGEKFKTKIFDTAGNPRRQIKIYVNGRDIRVLHRLDTLLNDGDEVLVLLAATGG